MAPLLKGMVTWDDGSYIEDIYSVGVNTKYISSSAMKKISIFYECENADIFTK